MTAGAVPSGDVLDTTGGRRRRWPVGAAVLVVVLLWFQVRSTEAPDAAPAVRATTTPTVTSGWVARAGTGRPPGGLGGPPGVEQLTFVDDLTGFLVQPLCRAEAGGACGRRVLATTDGGRSWRPRGEVPPAFGYLDRFVAVSASEVAFLDGFLPTTSVDSADGGRTWQPHDLIRGDPRPAPAGAPLVTDVLPCPVSVCPPWLAWVDLATGQLHQLPGQPPAEWLQQLVAAPPGPDGDLLATAVAADASRAWMSRDGGRTWAQAVLPVPQHAGVATWIRGFAAGGGRAYAYVMVSAAAGAVQVAGFRTDDAGRSWDSLGFVDPSLGVPDGVLNGELVGADAAGLVHLSAQGGRTWDSTGILVGAGSISQQLPGGPVLATVVDASGLETYYRSADGSAWSRVTPPAG